MLRRVHLVVLGLSTTIAIGFLLRPGAAVGQRQATPPRSVDAAPWLAEQRVALADTAPVAPPPSSPEAERPAVTRVAAPPAPSGLANLRYPERLDAVPMTPWRQEQLRAFSPQELAMLDHKLGILARLRSCLSDRGVANEQGSVTVFLHYRMNADRSEAIGSGVDMLDSSLSREADRPFYECLRESHVHSAMAWYDPPPGGGEFHWATSFALPLERDGAYDYFAH